MVIVLDYKLGLWLLGGVEICEVVTIKTDYLITWLMNDKDSELKGMGYDQ